MNTCQSSSSPRTGNQPVNVGDTERLISAVAGGCAVVIGLSKLSVPSLLALAAGGALLARGLTGHCQVYEALGMSTAEGGSTCCSSRAESLRHAPSEVSVAASGELPPF